MRFGASLLAASLLVPSLAFAFPFGGQASTVVPCYNQAIFARLGPPRGGDYIWTTATKTYMFGPPSFAGQWLLGLASAPYYCVVSISPVIVWAGIAIDMMGSSGGAAGTIGGLLHGTTPTTAAPPPFVDFTSPNTLTNPTSPATIGHIVISEVYYNVDQPHGTKLKNQWVELYNGTTESVDLSGWKLEHFNSQTSIPSGTTLASRQYLFIMFDSSTESFWTIPTGAKVARISAPFSGGIVAEGDVLRLKKDASTLVDAVSWGTNTSAFSPNIAVSAQGYSAARKTLAQDTDKASDWVSSAFPTPGR